MNQYQQLIQYISSHGLPFRGNCVACGNTNTLSAALVDGFVLFHCYHTSCEIKGRYKHEATLGELLRPSYNLGHSISTDISDIYIVPQYFISPLQNPKCFNFLKCWKLLDIYAEGRVSIWYDPKLNRCVFGIKDNEGLLKGATGRLLVYNNNYPKWYIYSRIDSCPGIITNVDITGTAILVEDFISACMASNVSSSVALLGTNINTQTISYLRIFKQLYIALDPDATGKALKLQHQLSSYIDTRIIVLQKDIKYYSPQDLKDLKEYLE